MTHPTPQLTASLQLDFALFAQPAFIKPSVATRAAIGLESFVSVADDI